MLSPLYHRLATIATPRALVTGGLLWLASALGVVVLQARVSSRTGGLAVPDVRPFYAPGELHALLERYGEPGRRAFLEFTLYDVFYPLVAYAVAALVLTALMRALVPAHPRLVWLLALPLGGLIVELLEQAFFLVVLLSFPTPAPPFALAASVLTSLKFLLLFGLAASFAALGLWRVRSRAR